MNTSKRVSTAIVVSSAVGIAAFTIVAVVFVLPRGFPNLFSSMVDVVGVYPVPGDQDTYMIEIMVNAPASELEIGLFSQDGNPAYGERYLSTDGNRVVGLETESGMTRLLFFMDNVDVERPLLTPFGPVVLPSPTTIPNRLRGVIDFGGEF